MTAIHHLFIALCESIIIEMRKNGGQKKQWSRTTIATNSRMLDRRFAVIYDAAMRKRGRNVG